MEISKWFESGKAPAQVIALWLDEKMQPTGPRPVCAYSKVAQYDGKGDTGDAASFSCVDPNQVCLVSLLAIELCAKLTVLQGY